jgi:hypothetical protein
MCFVLDATSGPARDMANRVTIPVLADSASSKRLSKPLEHATCSTSVQLGQQA